eukprot:scaffold80_cov382-Prasinococcus_capsulatus_cf.AAC.14
MRASSSPAARTSRRERQSEWPAALPSPRVGSPPPSAPHDGRPPLDTGWLPRVGSARPDARRPNGIGRSCAVGRVCGTPTRRALPSCLFGHMTVPGAFAVARTGPQGS